ncbi:pantetheine-phosphate adenylyltransferase [Crocinitomicaceae bacterium]|nr:pantetheine-phosphate adenylyltransferase [Crocinitomicaceae bacterium]MDB4324579.1 pantetheine-phosphate adenylyltransferase [Crocinitomicaceae bacterium]
MKKIGLFPGSFDPFTKGHEAIINKSLTVFDEVIIGIGVNTSKEYLFSLKNRIKHIQSLFDGNSNVSIREFQSLTVDFCKELSATHIIRGLRDTKDFEYEKSIAHMNYSLEGIDTLFFLTNQELTAISSSIVREIYKNNGSIEQFVSKSELLK